MLGHFGDVYDVDLRRDVPLCRPTEYPFFFSKHKCILYRYLPFFLECQYVLVNYRKSHIVIISV